MSFNRDVPGLKHMTDEFSVINKVKYIFAIKNTPSTWYAEIYSSCHKCTASQYELTEKRGITTSNLNTLECVFKRI